jgi:hypothetical protein
VWNAIDSGLSGPSQLPQGTQVAADDGVQNDSVPDSWGNPNTLQDHVEDHAADFNIDPLDPYAKENYANQAQEFFQRSFDEGLPTRIDQDGYLRTYDPATNTFGSYNPDGTTRTYFKPDAGYNYFNEQPGTLYINGESVDSASTSSMQEPAATSPSEPISAGGGASNGGRLLPQMQEPVRSNEFPIDDEPKL